MTAVLAVEGVTVRFGGVTAVEDVSFAAAAGELLALIGPNGAGKTTLMRAVTGVVRPQQGSLRLAGEVITGLPVHARIRKGLAISQQLVRPLAAMSVLDNVALAAGYRRTARPLAALLQRGAEAERATARRLLALVGIADDAEAMPAKLPLGVLKRLEVARALALDPKLLLLDEPLAGLNSGEARALADGIRALAGDGRTVILIEHNLSEVLRISDRLLVLDNGRLIGEGAPRAVMAEPAVRAAYLGEGGGDAAA